MDGDPAGCGGSGTRDRQRPPPAARARVSRQTCLGRARAARRHPALLGEGFEVGPKVALTVGTDSAIGKMTATLEIERAAREAGLSPSSSPRDRPA